MLFRSHDVRVIRLPRHAASCPVGLGVSCSADRNIKAKITEEGIFVEQLEKNPARFVPERAPELAPAVDIDLDRAMDEVRKELSKYPVKTRLNLSGTLIVARDIAHAQIKKMLDEGKAMPEYMKKHPVYYAGPAKTPKGMASGRRNNRRKRKWHVQFVNVKLEKMYTAELHIFILLLIILLLLLPMKLATQLLGAVLEH